MRWRSRSAAGHLVEIPSLPTLADGLAGQIDDDALAIGRFGLDDIAVITESETADAIAWLWKQRGCPPRGIGRGHRRRHPAPARARDLPFPVVCVVSGGNIDDERFRAAVGIT